MGKSPAKWIKTILFGKKASRSSVSKGKYTTKPTTEKETWVAAKEPTGDLPVDPPSVSEPTPGIDRNGGNSVLEREVSSEMLVDEVVMFPGSQNASKQGITGCSAPDDLESTRLEKAAVKTQAAFRGYLARRAFRALRGIIRLQALVRGHLVRRQAGATLRCILGILKLQALVRHQEAHLFDADIQDRKKFSLRKPLFLRCSPTAMPLCLQYGQEEPNSAWNWLERWTSSRFWEPLPLPKKTLSSKSHKRQGGNQNAETATSRSKRIIRKVPDNGSVHSTSDTGKPKRIPRKVPSNAIDPVPEHLQNELEKVKRNLRKVSSNSMAESTDRLELETEKPKKPSFRKPSSSTVPDITDNGTSESSENKNRDISVGVLKRPSLRKPSNSTLPDIPDNGTFEASEHENLDITVAVSNDIPKENEETSPKLLVVDEPLGVFHDDPSPLESSHLENVQKDEIVHATNGELLISKEEPCSNENQKTSRRKSSFSEKQENLENGSQNSPTLPSYMAPTKSAKAKLRGSNSPRLVPDVIENNGFTRRHSLPSPINGKLNALSPRVQKLVQASGKGGTKTEKSLLSSRDGSEKVMQAEWRR
ncbi:hypothetical protein GIB67_033051 [Kingdonia uniflora]|uniref:DUF4005 domain-containing protein n=1 Tax=Kingdonia uniflora TaxID=39325 RepID=A0A7J7MYP7_9MAGN|nr:hypothetical protein GIB67_033051 [Kingdonia uniflora]